MKAALARFGIALALLALAIPGLVLPRVAFASTRGLKEDLDSCPNPAPWWCARSAYETSTCPDGTLSWRGCYDWYDIS